MVEGKELRIGNMVKCTVHLPVGFNIPRISFTEIQEIREGAVETNVGTRKYREIAPLTLTEEILEKSGFENHSGEWTLDVNGAPFIMERIGEDFYYTEGKGVKLSRPIKYIHDFQNLFFCITGREASIRL